MMLSAFTESSHSRSSCFADPSCHQALHHLIHLMRKQPWIRSGVDDAASSKADGRTGGKSADGAYGTIGIFASAPGRIELAGNHEIGRAHV